jgi:hypothetical protein
MIPTHSTWIHHCFPDTLRWWKKVRKCSIVLVLYTHIIYIYEHQKWILVYASRKNKPITSLPLCLMDCPTNLSLERDEWTENERDERRSDCKTVYQTKYRNFFIFQHRLLSLCFYSCWWIGLRRNSSNHQVSDNIYKQIKWGRFKFMHHSTHVY